MLVCVFQDKNNSSMLELVFKAAVACQQVWPKSRNIGCIPKYKIPNNVISNKLRHFFVCVKNELEFDHHQCYKKIEYFCKVECHIGLFLQIGFVKHFDESGAVSTFVIFEQFHRFWVEYRLFHHFVGIRKKYVFTIRTLTIRYEGTIKVILKESYSFDSGSM